MAKEIIQIIIQEGIESTPERFAIQYYDTEINQNDQKFVFYADLSEEEKSTYDSFVALSQVKID